MTDATQNPSKTSDIDSALPLPGLDGANPLGFLAALGVLQTATSAHPDKPVKMSWSADPSGWRPWIHGVELTIPRLARAIAHRLNCPFTPNEPAERACDSARARFETARSKFRATSGELKKQGLKGKEREAEKARVLEPLRQEMHELREHWLESLRRCVPSEELGLGKHLDATVDELREASSRALSRARLGQREIVDLFASFGSDGCHVPKGEKMQATSFCFTTGSGHQYFLDTVRQLTGRLDASRFELALSRVSELADEKFSMRWEPLEDRRYALMAADPTSPGNEAKTSWPLNLLAYRGLSLIPSVPTAKGLRTPGWSSQRAPTWTWPIWRGAISAHVVRSLLAHPALTAETLDPQQLGHLGIHALYRSVRIQVGTPPLHKLNFTPAHQIA
jgi:hypothetical protein